jgi:hypothetical protein
MEFLTQLWLPILLSAVFVFIVSSIIHMVLQTHNSDVKKMNGEDAVLEAMRTNGVAPGSYMFPHAGTPKEMGTPEMVAKFEKGPVGWLTVLPAGGFTMGKSLAWWFVHSLIIGMLAAYVGWNGLGADAHYLNVFRVVGTAAILGYAIGHLHDSIWKGQPWGTTMKFVLDGVVYGLVTAGTFGWLWP